MKSIIPPGAVLISLMLTAFAAAPDNDDFSRREALPSQDVIDLPIQLTGAPTYEPLDPVSQPLSKGSAAEGFGSLWYEWTAPRNGWFTAAAVRNDGVAWRTRVYEGG